MSEFKSVIQIIATLTVGETHYGLAIETYPGDPLLDKKLRYLQRAKDSTLRILAEKDGKRSAE